MTDRALAAYIALILAQRQAELMKVDAMERYLQGVGAFKGPRTSELRKERKSTRRE